MENPRDEELLSSLSERLISLSGINLDLITDPNKPSAVKADQETLFGLKVATVKALGFTPALLSRITLIELPIIEEIYSGERNYSDVMQLEFEQMSRLNQILTTLALNFAIAEYSDLQLVVVVGTLYKNLGVSIETISRYTSIPRDELEAFMLNPTSLNLADRYKLAISASLIYRLLLSR